MKAPKWHRWLSGVFTIAIVLASLLVAPLSAKAEARTFVIEMRTFQFSPNLLQANPGDVITIRVFNNDTTGHTLNITGYSVHIGTQASPLQPGQNGTATFTADRNGTFWFFCDILGHASQSGSGYTGMAGRLIVGPPPGPLDITVPLVIAGVAGAAVLAGLVIWLRRRSRNA